MHSSATRWGGGRSSKTWAEVSVARGGQETSSRGQCRGCCRVETKIFSLGDGRPRKLGQPGAGFRIWVSEVNRAFVAADAAVEPLGVIFGVGHYGKGRSVAGVPGDLILLGIKQLCATLSSVFTTFGTCGPHAEFFPLCRQT